MKSLTEIKDLVAKIPGKSTIAVVLILLGIIWLLLPMVSINKSYPFASIDARLLLTGLAFLGWITKLIFTQLQQHRSNVFSMFLLKIKSLWGQLKKGSANAKVSCKEYAKQLKHKAKKDKDKRRLRKLPWYVVLGAPQSGKKHIISNLGLYCSQPKHFGDEAESYIKKFPDYDWWFSEQAVFIDAVSHDKESNSQSWKSFLKLLKRERKHKPLNGVILTFSLADILLYTNQQRQEFIQDICHYIREVHQTFKSQIPVYLVLTKADLVEGFMEFFNDLSKEDLRQVWGMTLPLELCDEAQKVTSFFNEEYTAIVNKLRSQVLWALDNERALRGRELIHSFPQQMQLLRRPIETFIMELFAGVRFPKALQMRGVYFCSSKQEGEPHDFLLQAMSKKFQLVPPVVERPQRMGECYFIRRLFHEVIYPEAKILGDSERSKKLRKYFFQVSKVAAPLVVVLTIIGMHEGYKENIDKIQAVENNLAEYQQLKLKLNSQSDSLTDMLPLLRQLNVASLTYSKHIPIGMHLLFETSIIRHHINASLQRALSNEYIPRIAANIENKLNNYITDQNLLYATLKAYLAFSSTSNTAQEAIKAPMEFNWSEQFKKSPQTIKQLRYYLDLALQQSVSKLPLDGELISRIRSELEAIVPSKRAYGLLQLKAAVGALPKLYINSAVGAHFADVFESKNKKQLVIPALYTGVGFKNIFLKQYQPIADEVSEDNKAVGLSHGAYETQTYSQIVSVMEDTYSSNYINQWNSALATIKVKPFGDLNNAIGVVQLLISENSPMSKLFTLIYNNSYDINNTNVDVTQNFKSINQFQLGSGAESWHNTQKVLNKIQAYLMTLQQSKDVNKAEYQAVLKTIQTGKSPILQLISIASKAPSPIKGWLNAIAINSWKVLIAGAHEYTNVLWQSEVMQSYDDDIKARYPIDPHSESNVSISAFNQFYGPTGTLRTFFTKYIQPFIETDKIKWQLYQISGLSFQLDEAEIALFQRAMTVSNNYFINKGIKAKLSFSIKPLTLDSNASNISFNIGGHYLNYSHGPQHVTNLYWPLPTDDQQAEIILTGFNGEQYSKSANGPWAIFKLLDKGSLRELNKGVYEFNINIHGHYASYELYGLSEEDIYSLTSLKNFNLPNKIAG